jgi:hypothetical protein
MDLALALLAFGGHTALCVWLFNRLHATPWPCRTIRWLERAILLFAAAVVVVYAARFYLAGYVLLDGWYAAQAGGLWLAYPAVSLVAAVLAVPLWVIPKLRQRLPAALASNHTQRLDLAARLGHKPAGTPLAAWMAAIPGNEIFDLRVQTKTLHISGLPLALDGLSIAHLSDLHMTGRFTRPFYEEVIDAACALSPDIVVITGDICEEVHCLDWIVPLLGRLTCCHGKFFVLGNHDARLGDVGPLRARLAEAGLTDVAGRWLVCQVRGSELLVCGSERPWFGTAPEMGAAPHGLFRLMLSHSPDELPWAKRHGIDLMLAGHNHGGQIRLPLVGPLISPSRFGSRYAGGLYHEPPTLLHVSRGIAGLHPIRFNCPPELALLVLRRAPAAARCGEKRDEKPLA